MFGAELREELSIEIRMESMGSVETCYLCGEGVFNMATAWLCLGNEDLGRVCPRCLEGGPNGAAARILECVREDEIRLEFRRALAEQVRLCGEWASLSDLSAAEHSAHGFSCKPVAEEWPFGPLPGIREESNGPTTEAQAARARGDTGGRAAADIA